MKLHERVFVACLALGLVLAACTGGSDDVAAPTAVPVVETPTAAEADPTPTVKVVTPEASDVERLAAVIAAFDSAIEAGDAPESLIAYDLLDSTVAEDGVVTLNICAWTGDTVFETVRDSIWRTAVDDDGAVIATHITTPVTSGDCINSHLIETAIATFDEFDQYWNQVNGDPVSFDANPESTILLTDGVREIFGSTFAEWVENDIYFVGGSPSGPLVETAVAPILWRRYENNNQAILELASCREMVPESGLYRDGVLVDDLRAPEDPGLHSVDSIQLVRDPSEQGSWRVAGRQGLSWSDCFATGDWPGAASFWQERVVPFEALVP